jgi:hypothetical protein
VSEAPVEAPKERKYESFNPDTYKTDEQKKEEVRIPYTDEQKKEEVRIPYTDEQKKEEVRIPYPYFLPSVHIKQTNKRKKR